MNLKDKFIILTTLITVISANEITKHLKSDNDLSNISENQNTDSKNPSKRGAYYHGHGLLPDAFGAHLHHSPLLEHAKPLAFGAAPIPFNSPGFPHLHTAVAPSNHLHLPGHYHAHHGLAKPFHFGVPFAAAVPPVAAIAPTQYTIRPGGAVVQSYNVNYPKTNFHQHKPLFPSYAVAAPAPVPTHFHYHTGFVPPHAHHHIGLPVSSPPIAAPVSPVPSFIPFGSVGQLAPVAPLAPLNPVAPATPIAPFQPVATAPPAPLIPQHFFVNRPTTPIGIQFTTIPALPIIPQRPVLFPTVPTFPAPVMPIGDSALAPGQIQPIAPTIPTTFATQAPWRPVIISNPAPTLPPQPPSPQPQPSASGNRPPISLLPPYGPPVRENSNLEDFQLTQVYQAPNNQYNQQQRETGYFDDKGYHY